MRFVSGFIPVFFAVTSASLALAPAPAARADLSDNFSTNPLTDGSAILQSTDPINAAARFTYNAAAGTLTAHYDSTAATTKLLFALPNNQHLTQNDSFKATATFTIPQAQFISPPDFGAQVPSFGLVNSTLTGNIRASTADENFVEVAQGNAYDIMTFDYFPTQDPTFGGSSASLSTIPTQQSGVTFDTSFSPYFNYENTTLPFDQTITATYEYDAASGLATLDWGTGSLSVDLSGAIFDMDSFAITLWNDPNLTATDPAVPSGSPVGGDVVFDSFSVQTVPEPASLAMMAAGLLLLGKRRR